MTACPRDYVSQGKMKPCMEVMSYMRSQGHFFMSLTAFWSLLRQFIALGSHSNSFHHTARRIAYVKAEKWSLVTPVIPPRKEMLWITIPCSLVDCWTRPPWNLPGRTWEISSMWDIYPAGWQGLWQFLIISEPGPEERTLLASLLWAPHPVQLSGPVLIHSRTFGNWVFRNIWCGLLGVATEMPGRNAATKQAFYQEVLCRQPKNLF